MNTVPRPGDVIRVGRAASVQFDGRSGFMFWVSRVDDRLTYVGWCWLLGYQLNRRGDAVQRRWIFVRVAGLHPVTGPGNETVTEGKEPGP